MLTGSTFSQTLRKAAPILSRRFFSCSHKQIPRSFTTHVPTPSPRATHTQVFRHALQQKRLVSRTARRNVEATFPPELPYTNEEIARHAVKKSSHFPDTSSNVVAYWLLGSAASVFGIVIFGGWTRLTESGSETRILHTIHR
jgi:heme a synthase